MTAASRLEQRFDHRLGADASRGRLAMRPSGFDLVSSFLLAVLVMLATLVMILLTIWMLDRSDRQRNDRLPPRTLVAGSLSAGQPASFEMPQVAEVVNLASPSLADLVSEVESVSQQVASGLSAETISGRQSRDGLIPGPDEDGSGTQPSQRWELTFLAPNRLDYARQLDFHSIELGAFGGGLAGIDYASGLATAPLVRHLQDASLEDRLYFWWVRPSPLARYEGQLLAGAGIDIAGRQIVKFIPRELEKQLLEMELEYARSHGVWSPGVIANTVFRSEPAGVQFRFVVVSQRYKRGAVVAGQRRAKKLT